MLRYPHCFTGRGVTANMSVLGTDDSGFESRRPDKQRANKQGRSSLCFRSLNGSAAQKETIP